MRLRAAVQGEVEHATAQLGMPTRTEIDAAHRKIVQLERELRRLRDRMDDGDGDRPGASRCGSGERVKSAAPKRAATSSRASKVAKPAPRKNDKQVASAKTKPVKGKGKPTKA